MILAGVIWALLGVGEITRTSPAAVVPGVWHLLVPAQISAAVWIATGLTAAFLAATKHNSSLGLFLLVFAPGIRFFSYFWSWIVYVIPGIQEGYDRGWFNSLFYLLMLLWIGHLSRISEGIRAPIRGKRVK